MEQNVCMRILGEWRNRRELPVNDEATHIMYNLLVCNFFNDEA